MSGGLKLTVLFGEHDRADGGYLADTLTGIYARHELRTSVLMRGVEGFGIKHHLRTDRTLTLSEDLPLVSVAVDEPPRIEAALKEVERLRFDGLVTLQRVRMLSTRPAPVELPWQDAADTKLTAYLGRYDRIDGRPAYERVVGLLHERGVAGASVFLGVDGTLGGVRQRARFLGRNAAVPLMVIGVGNSGPIARVVPELTAMLERPLLIAERIALCKHDGVLLSRPKHLPETDAAGLRIWQKLTIYSSEQAAHHGRPLHHRLIRELRRGGASGATTIRGTWGYHGGHEPHGDAFWELRRRVPLLTIVVDSPERTQGWFDLVHHLTEETGLVTSEMVPGFRATGPDIHSGSLRLSQTP